MLGMGIQSEIAAPESEKNRPDRHLSCQEAIEPAFQAVAEMARRSEWSTGEFAAALVDLADNHMLALAAKRDRPANRGSQTLRFALFALLILLAVVTMASMVMRVWELTH